MMFGRIWFLHIIGASKPRSQAALKKSCPVTAVQPSSPQPPLHVMFKQLRQKTTSSMINAFPASIFVRSFKYWTLFLPTQKIVQRSEVFEHVPFVASSFVSFASTFGTPSQFSQSCPLGMSTRPLCRTSLRNIYNLMSLLSLGRHNCAEENGCRASTDVRLKKLFQLGHICPGAAGIALSTKPSWKGWRKRNIEWLRNIRIHWRNW